ncbi:MAG: hypothetical protein AB8B60_03100 [Sulfitobacter sp.]
MTFRRNAALLALTLLVGACTQQPLTGNAPTRLEVDPLGPHAAPIVSSGLTEEARALTASAKGIVRASTLKGAMIGAAIGCGLGALTGSDASNCAKVAAVGAVGGAALGHRAGKRDVKRRVELASPNALVRNLRRANDSLATIQSDLPALLAAQDAELNRLTLSFAANQITAEAHDRQIDAIRAERRALADALSLSAAQAKVASANLREATSKGHHGLEWHISASDQLAREALSARADITLL